MVLTEFEGQNAPWAMGDASLWPRYSKVVLLNERCSFAIALWSSYDDLTYLKACRLRRPERQLKPRVTENTGDEEWLHAFRYRGTSSARHGLHRWTISIMWWR